MLREELDQQSIRNELEAGIDQLQQAGAGVMVIACNTLYGFLGQVDEQVISLPQLVTAQVASALVLCTSRARQMQVYPAQWDYLMPADQCRLDCAIDELLKGREPIEILQQIIAEQPSPTIVLGCSELSLIVSKLQVAGKRLIDPIELAVERLLEISFEARRKVA
jgi:aspartate/glutamate racemase